MNLSYLKKIIGESIDEALRTTHQNSLVENVVNNHINQLILEKKSKKKKSHKKGGDSFKIRAIKNAADNKLIKKSTLAYIYDGAKTQEEKDAARSKMSKLLNGELPFGEKGIDRLYQAIRRR